MTKEEIEGRLNKAIALLQERDAILLDLVYDINERTVTHRLGMYLQSLFEEFDVDCEYNRNFDPASEQNFTKVLTYAIESPTVFMGDTEAKTVYPDIIVHKRKSDFNLLAIEVKMGWKNSKGDFDKIKAKGYKNQLGYKFSAYLVLGPNTDVYLEWI